ncbi:uncharacterized protein P884DRAFT_195582 [Thermothelomyces heterothallicus CBS 202.75]|uniref:uncharacterized protein n=1 Tax=Thermothelomyces heterothallicus CBS 202.75 TaxID=1149848 RepID=UPI003742EFD5
MLFPEEKYPCPIAGCSKSFFRRGNIAIHILAHDRISVVECETCEKTFTRKTDLRRHYNSVHSQERKYSCQYCSMRFNRNDILTRLVVSCKSKRQ